eukprot:gnl/TRDRNA2_/TRDRNA2_84847_c0_seq3.p1 gnl/TRDRNA2_/TRDRNA2_84847_c0~~gnl/TRDRNA2_/TRDRNA2_84847_c0_seq3.p1  ORF type:complete len:361 (+),score=44.65 gnl/TRDRNA2_/TRDRNA2_84847_c0_seq3:165-1247(+)
MGVAVCFKIVMYLLSLSTMKLVVKYVFVNTHFPYPVFVTGTHMLSSSIVGFCIVQHTNLMAGKSFMLPSLRELCFQLLPLAVAVVWSLIACNQALVFVSAAFSEMIAGTTAVFAACLLIIMGVPFSPWLFIPTCVVVLGACLAVEGEMYFSLWGMLLCLISNFCRSWKVVMQQHMMTGDLKDKYDPLTLLSWQCLLGFLVICVWQAFTEGAEPFRKFEAADNQLSIVLAVGVSCFNAIVLNCFAMYTVKDLGAVGNTIAAQTKSVLIIIGGVAFFHESVKLIQLVGFLFVLSGAFWYARMEKGLKASMKEQEAAKGASLDPSVKLMGAIPADSESTKDASSRATPTTDTQSTLSTRTSGS